MRNKKIRSAALAMAAVILFSVPSYASFRAVGKDGTVVTEADQLGTVGTAKNPIVSVDGTGIEFETWAEGLYFTQGCTYLNITEKNDAAITLIPVYEPESKQVTVKAGGGKFGTESSVKVTVNFDDGTLDPDLEMLEKDPAKDLSTVLSALTPEYTGFQPYFYLFEASTANKRIFTDKNDPSKKRTDDADLETAVYDVLEQGEITLVWKDNDDPEGWNSGQQAAAKFIAAVGDLSEADYHERLGGSEELPYGTVSVTKQLPGAPVSLYTWVLKKGSTEADRQSGAGISTYVKTGMDGTYDGANLSEAITYGSKEYTLATKALTFTAYQRPAIGSETLE